LEEIQPNPSKTQYLEAVEMDFGLASENLAGEILAHLESINHELSFKF
jgi:hypothetical protein